MPDLTQYFKLLVISAMKIVSQLAVMILHFLQSHKVLQSCYNYQYTLFNFLFSAVRPAVHRLKIHTVVRNQIPLTN